MFLQLTRTGPGARELSWLVRKHPEREQRFELPFGEATVWWSAYQPEHASLCTCVEVDPVQLVRGHVGSDQDGPLAQYVNDRPYVASSLLSVALVRLYRSAMKAAPEGVEDCDAPYEVFLPVVPARGGARLIHELFEPLGYAIELQRLPRDPEVPAWGESSLYSLRLRRTGSLARLLEHLYVLIPVLDDSKHYWVGEDEVDKLLRVGGDWLQQHPAHERIAERYLKHRRGLVRRAVEALVPEVEEPEEPVEAALRENQPTLNGQRLNRVVALLGELGVTEVADLGCGEGKLLAELVKERSFTRLVGIDVSAVSLERATRRLHLDRNPHRSERITLWTGSVTYRDRRLDGVQAAVLVEVIEHLDEDRLPLLEAAVFRANRPAHVVVTTPNAEYNACFADLPEGRFRHADHRFEWDRATFETWARGVAERCGYTVRFEGIGPEHETLGTPTQLACFTREGA